MQNIETFESVWRESLAELYDAEQQTIEKMPAIIEAAESAELKTALELHLTETREHAERLAAILAGLDGDTPRRICDPMRALLAKSLLAAAWHEPSAARDFALISTARQVEHFEMASYGAAATLGRMLGHDAAAALLKKTLRDERETAAYLAQLAEATVMGEELEDLAMEEEAPA